MQETIQHDRPRGEIGDVVEKRKERRSPGGEERKGGGGRKKERGEEKKPNWREKVWSCEKRKVSG
jgi:hypothetical protein